MAKKIIDLTLLDSKLSKSFAAVKEDIGSLQDLQDKTKKELLLEIKKLRDDQLLLKGHLKSLSQKSKNAKQKPGDYVTRQELEEKFNQIAQRRNFGLKYGIMDFFTEEITDNEVVRPPTPK